jgi:hypothetical protein
MSLHSNMWEEAHRDKSNKNGYTYMNNVYIYLEQNVTEERT